MLSAQRSAEFAAPLRHGRAMPRRSGAGTLAGWLSLRGVRTRPVLEPKQAAGRGMRLMWQAAPASCRDDFRADQDGSVAVVSGDLPGDLEQRRRMGFGSYQTAWSWLHKIRKAMVTPKRSPLRDRVEADETCWGGPKPGTWCRRQDGHRRCSRER
jgi:hypothetical protein